MNNSIVILKNVTKIAKSTPILNNINLEVESGKVYGIIGRNGSGKSILFKVISGLISPTKGKIQVFGEDIINGSFPKDFGILLDTPGFLPHYTGFKNLKMLSSIKNLISDEEVKNVIKLVGLDPNDSKPVKKYSLGMKQRLGIAQAIMENPKLVILDEPMNGLDEQGVVDIRKLILELNSKGVTFLLSSHNSEDINLLCDYVYKMDNGSIDLQASPRQDVK